MLIDFNNLDLNSLYTEYGSQDYYRSVLDFLTIYKNQDFFHSNTSGSTGHPKSIQIEKIRAEASAAISNQYFGISHSSHFLLALDIKFIGSKLLLIRAHIAKAKVTIVLPSLKFYEDDYEQDFDFVSLTPLHVYSILENRPSALKHFKKCLIGSSPVSKQLDEKLRDLNIDTKFYESFGMTETLSHIAIRDISGHAQTFEVLDGYKISVTEDHCLSIEHPIVLPEKIITNDVIKILDPSHFQYLGRRDNIINLNGIKLNPEYIENELSTYYPEPFIIAGEPDDKLGEHVIMILKNNTSSLSKEDILNKLRATSLPSYCLPKEIYLCENWVETLSFKPIREEIKASKAKTPLL